MGAALESTESSSSAPGAKGSKAKKGKKGKGGLSDAMKAKIAAEQEARQKEEELRK